MSDTYDNRKGTKAPASGGTLNHSIAGATGKLAPGTYDLEVLGVTGQKPRIVVMFQAPDGHMHYEQFEHWPASLGTGARLRGEVGPSSRGFVVQRHTDRYRAERADTLEPLTDWCDTIGDLIKAIPTGWKPATTELKEITHAGGKFQPRVYRPETGSKG